MVLQLVNALVTGTLFMSRGSDEDKKTVIDAMYSSYRQSFPNVRDITPAQVMARPSSEVLLVDCRKRYEQEASVIKGNVVLRGETKDEYILEQKKDVVFYCTIGYRSGMAAQRFLQEYPEAEGRVYNLAGSCLSWAHAGGEFVTLRDGNAVAKLHVVSCFSSPCQTGLRWIKNMLQVDAAWNLAPERIETVTMWDGLLARALSWQPWA